MNRTPTFFARFLGTALLLVGLLAWVGCDSGGDDGFSEEDLIGTYTMTTLTFETDGTGVVDANVLDAEDGTVTMQFLANSRFQLQRSGGLVIPGEYDVSDDDVSLNFDNSFANERSELLLPDNITLNIVQDAQVLEREVRLENVLLSDFDPDLFGEDFRSNGTLIVRLQRS